MNSAAELPGWVALLTSLLILLGAGFTFVGAIGLLRLKSFYDRVHAPTLGTTLGMACIVIASMIFFSATQTRPAVHELLIVVFITITTPVTLMLLVRAALFRDHAENGSQEAEQDAAPDKDNAH